MTQSHLKATPDELFTVEARNLMGKTTIVALYRNLESADQALQELKTNGIDRQDVSLALLYPDAQEPENGENGTMANGAGLGVLVGSLTGLVMGLSTFVVPGLGPIVVAGPLAAALGGATGAAIGAGVGAITGSLTAALVAIDVPAEKADSYSEAVSRGDTLLTVKAPGDMLELATTIIKGYDPVTIEYHSAHWPQSGMADGEMPEQPYFNEPSPDREKVFEDSDSTD